MKGKLHPTNDVTINPSGNESILDIIAYWREPAALRAHRPQRGNPRRSGRSHDERHPSHCGGRTDS